MTAHHTSVKKAGQPTAATSSLTSLAQRIHTPATPAAAPVVVDAQGLIQSTTDYDAFKILNTNRPVVEQHVKYLMEQIRDKNLLHLRPIDVNSEFGIVDGQHRLEAARRLGLPIFYRVGQLTDDDMATLNRASRNWSATDYLHHWTQKGKPAYCILSDFLERYPDMGVSSAQMLLSAGDGLAQTAFREGYYQVGNVERGEQVVEFLQRVRSEGAFKYAFDSRFVMSVHFCWAYVAGFNAETMLRKLMLQPTELVRCATQKQYLALMERLYNYKTTEKLQVSFRKAKATR